MKLDHYSNKRKINAPLISKTKPDGTENNNNRIEIGPTKLSFNEYSIKIISEKITRGAHSEIIVIIFNMVGIIYWFWRRISIIIT